MDAVNPPLQPKIPMGSGIQQTVTEPKLSHQKSRDYMHHPSSNQMQGNSNQYLNYGNTTRNKDIMDGHSNDPIQQTSKITKSIVSRDANSKANEKVNLYTSSVNGVLQTENSQVGMSTVIMAPTGVHAINLTDQKAEDEQISNKLEQQVTVQNNLENQDQDVQKERKNLQSQNGATSSQGGINDRQPAKIKRILIQTKKTNIEFMTPRLNSQREMYRTTRDDNFLGGSSQGSLMINQDNLYLASLQKSSLINQFEKKNNIFSSVISNCTNAVKIPSLSSAIGRKQDTKIFPQGVMNTVRNMRDNLESVSNNHHHMSRKRLRSQQSNQQNSVLNNSPKLEKYVINDYTSSNSGIDPETQKIVFGRGMGFLQLTKISRLRSKDAKIEQIIANKMMKEQALNDDSHLQYNQTRQRAGLLDREQTQQKSQVSVRGARTEHQMESKVLRNTIENIQPFKSVQQAQEQERLHKEKNLLRDAFMEGYYSSERDQKRLEAQSIQINKQYRRESNQVAMLSQLTKNQQISPIKISNDQELNNHFTISNDIQRTKADDRILCDDQEEDSSPQLSMGKISRQAEGQQISDYQVSPQPKGGMIGSLRLHKLASEVSLPTSNVYFNQKSSAMLINQKSGVHKIPVRKNTGDYKVNLLKLRTPGPESLGENNGADNSNFGQSGFNRAQFLSDKEYFRLINELQLQDSKSTMKLSLQQNNSNHQQHSTFHKQGLKQEMLAPKFNSLIFVFKKLAKYFVSMKPLFDVCTKLIQKSCLINYDDIPSALFQVMTGREKSHFDDTAQNYSYCEVYHSGLEYIRQQKEEQGEVKHQHDHQISQLQVEMKIRDDMISRMEIDIQSLKEINSSSVYQQYVSLAEHNSSLIKEKNQLLFKVEELKDEISQLRAKFSRSNDELAKTQKLLSYTQDDKDRLDSKAQHYKQKITKLKDKMQTECIDNSNFVAIVNKYRQIIAQLEKQIRQEGNIRSQLEKDIDLLLMGQALTDQAKVNGRAEVIGQSNQKQNFSPQQEQTLSKYFETPGVMPKITNKGFLSQNSQVSAFQDSPPKQS